jgi:hypothetical protein
MAITIDERLALLLEATESLTTSVAAHNRLIQQIPGGLLCAPAESQPPDNGRTLPWPETGTGRPPRWWSKRSRLPAAARSTPTLTSTRRVNCGTRSRSNRKRKTPQQTKTTKRKNSMTRTIRYTPNKSYELPSEGVHRAQLTDIKDLPPALDSKGEQHERLRFIWGLKDQVNSFGDPMRVFATYNLSLHPQSFLSRAIFDITGREPGSEFDLDSLLGIECDLVIKHNRAPDGRVYANVSSILRPKTAAGPAEEKRVRRATEKVDADIPF